MAASGGVPSVALLLAEDASPDGLAHEIRAGLRVHAFRVTLKDGVRLACVKEVKPGAPSDGFVVLLHGRLHTKSRGPMALLQPLLAYNTLAFDARGMGESEGETGYSNVQEEVDDLHELLGQLRLPILAIVGHSKGAVVALQLAAQHALPCALVVNVSGRYDASNLSTPQSRFTPAQEAELQDKGEFVWLNYRAGPEPDRPLRRPYKVTREAVEHHKQRRLDCVRDIPQGVHILSLHGRADGTVPYLNALKMDEALQRGGATNDVMLLEGVAHNWDAPGEPALLAALVGGWLAARSAARPTRPPELIDHLGLDRGRLSGTATPVPPSARATPVPFA